MNLTPRQRALTRQTVSLLLAYPDNRLIEQLPMLEAVAAELPQQVAVPLRRMLAHLRGTAAQQLAEDYVATFDLRRRCCLYLSYYPHGDTRRRGQALVRFREIYRAAGLEPDPSELPDHLSVVLEFAAIGDPATGGALLAEHRPGLELLRAALERARSPYADVIVAVLATLEDLTPQEAAEARRLAAEGPPAEQVGLGTATFIPADALGLGGRR